MLEGLAELRTQTRGDPRVVVAILDGAVDLAHPALTAGPFVQLPTLTTDRPTRHGTHVASVAVGQGLGIAPACRGVSIPVFQENAEGELQACSQLDLARAIRQAVDAGAQVINVSGGQLASGGKAEPFLAEAVRYCAAQGALIVAAAGNEGCECLYVPAALPAVLAVGAMGADGRPLNFSNWGYGGQGLLAPGENVLGAAPGGGTALRSGTSFATPIVSGIIALLLSRQLERGEAANPRAVRDALLASARACQPGEAPDCARYLAGRLDLPGARRILERQAPLPQPGQIQLGEVPNRVLTTGEMIGRTLSHYKILRQLGVGAMGWTYLAEDLSLGRKVALKIQAEGNSRRHFEQEARILAVFDHPNIVRFDSEGEAEGLRFFTMEYIEGPTLREILPAQGFPLNDFFDLAIQVAEALGAIHARGIIYRDLKPANILVTLEGTVKIVDFDVARRQEDPYEFWTQVGVLVGTVPYMSPEQSRGDAVTPASDVFSLGILLYEMLTGKLPFQGCGTTSCALAVQHETPPPVTAARPDLPPGLVALIERCLEKDPLRRHPSAVQIVPDLLQSREHADFTNPGCEAKRDEESGLGTYIPRGGSTEVADIQDRIHAAQSSEEGREPPEDCVPPAVAAAAAQPGRVVAADCGCGGGHGGPCSCSGRLAYAIGQLGYDLVSEARRDSIAQSMAGRNVQVPADLLAHLETNPWEAEAFVWTLNIDATPIYAVRPAGPFAGVAFERLREFLASQLNEGVERISVPGRISGRATLFSGQVVPVITPELRGMYSWSTDALITAVLGPPPAGGGGEAETYAKASDGIRNFIGRVYYALRNLGQSPEERAVNFAATQAFQVARSFQDAVDKGLVLDTTEVERSPICRPGSDCWDVKITFFNPSERLTQSRHVHRFTVDVSDVIPVTVGPVRSWAVY
jgi:serine/threonine protein kinase